MKKYTLYDAKYNSLMKLFRERTAQSIRIDMNDQKSLISFYKKQIILLECFEKLNENDKETIIEKFIYDGLLEKYYDIVVSYFNNNLEIPNSFFEQHISGVL